MGTKVLSVARDETSIGAALRERSDQCIRFPFALQQACHAAAEYRPGIKLNNSLCHLVSKYRKNAAASARLFPAFGGEKRAVAHVECRAECIAQKIARDRIFNLCDMVVQLAGTQKLFVCEEVLNKRNVRI